MDPSLLRERELFRKRALAQPTIEAKSKKAKSDDSSSKKKSKSAFHKSSKSDQDKKLISFDYKTHQGSSQYKFSVLRKIVNFMKNRHQQGDCHELTLEEILDESNQLDVSGKIRHWLKTEALQNNPKIDVVDGDRFAYKPKFNIRSRKALLRLLDKYDQQGLGGIAYEDIEESLPDAQKRVKGLVEHNHAIEITTPSTKKKVLFFNDQSYQFSVDEDLQKLWRSVAVDGVDEDKIEEYLDKQGISSMQDIGARKVAPAQRRRKGGKRNKTFKKLNDHMVGVLEDYTEK